MEIFRFGMVRMIVVGVSLQKDGLWIFPCGYRNEMTPYLTMLLLGGYTKRSGVVVVWYEVKELSRTTFLSSLVRTYRDVHWFVHRNSCITKQQTLSQAFATRVLNPAHNITATPLSTYNTNH